MSNDTPKMKYCLRCEQEKPATTEYWYRNKASLDGLYCICKDCDKIRKKKYYNENKHSISEQRKDWYKRHRDEQINRSKKWSRNNTARIRKRVKVHYQKNKSRIIVRVHRYRAQRRNLPSSFTLRQWEKCLEYFNHCCAVCGNQLRDLFGFVKPNTDHWIPISHEGDDNPGTVAENVICLCNSCNLSKGANLPDKWLKDKYGTRKANEILARIQTYFDSIESD